MIASNESVKQGLPTDAETEYTGVDDEQSVTLTEWTEHSGDTSDH